MHLLNNISKYSSSEVIIVDPEMSREITYELCKCVHCQTTWRVQPGSGRVRGFCTKCCGPTCGSKECLTCIPAEKALGW